MAPPSSAMVGAFAAVFYGVVAVAMGFINKAVMSVYGLEESNFLLLCQMAVTVAVLFFLRGAGRVQLAPISLTQAKKLLPVAILYNANVAFALASRPKVLVLTPLFDMLSRESRASIIAYLREHGETTAIVFSHRHDLTDMDAYMFWDFDRQYRFSSYDELVETVDGAGAQVEGGAPA